MSIEEMQKKESTKSLSDDKVNIPIIKYFWQASPLSGSRKSSIHKFLRNINCFEHFSDYELYLFSKFLHLRNYAQQEIVFEEGESGYGFYLLFEGNIDIYTMSATDSLNLVTQLSKYDYLGELALLEKLNKRNATAIASNKTTLLAIYKPDIDELIERYPIVAAKLFQGLSMIVAKRFNAIAADLKVMKEKIQKMDVVE